MKNVFKISYIPALDGLRGLAVMLVFLTHNSSWVLRPRSGSLGVDVFFVLSGFLITALLVQEFQNTGKVSMRNFYVRRFLRLLPALLLYALLINAAGLILGGEKQTQTWNDTVPMLLYLSNWVYAFGLSNPLYTQHTWSLATEEQYYLLWPTLFLFFQTREITIDKIARYALIIGLLSFAWRTILLVAFHVPESRVYYGLDTRLDGLLLGSALGCFVFTQQFKTLQNYLKSSVYLKGLIAHACIIAIVLIAFMPSTPNFVYFTIFIPSVNLLVCILIILALFDGLGSAKRFLENTYLKRLGKISYGFYLYHLIVIKVFANTLSFSPMITLICSFIVAYIMAEISFRLIEQPILKQKVRFRTG